MEKLTPVLRTAVLALVVLVLIPIVIHLWCGVLDISRGHLVSVGGLYFDINTSNIAEAIRNTSIDTSGIESGLSSIRSELSGLSSIDTELSKISIAIRLK